MYKTIRIETDDSHVSIRIGWRLSWKLRHDIVQPFIRALRALLARYFRGRGRSVQKIVFGRIDAEPKIHKARHPGTGPAKRTCTESEAHADGKRAAEAADAHCRVDLSANAHA